jgi:hypothetical protein
VLEPDVPEPVVPEPAAPEPDVEPEVPEPGVEVEPEVLPEPGVAEPDVPELDVSGLEVEPEVLPEPAVPELDVPGAVEPDVPEPVAPVEPVEPAPESLERLQPAKITVSKPAINMTFDLLNAEFITTPFIKINRPNFLTSLFKISFATISHSQFYIERTFHANLPMARTGAVSAAYKSFSKFLLPKVKITVKK